MSSIRIGVIDTETTGLDPNKGAEIIEIGITVLDVHDGVPDLEMLTNPKKRIQWGTLVNIGKEISANISGLTGITVEMLEGKPSPEDARRLFDAFLNQFKITALAAHNASFDKRMLETWGRGYNAMPWFCTLQLARRIWPDAPNHKNQTLRYYLKHPITDEQVAHRAVTDTQVTAWTLARIFQSDWFIENELADSKSAQEIVEKIESAPQDFGEFKISFGKHAGKRIKEIPVDYLQWMAGQQWVEGDLRKAVESRL